MSTQNGQGLTSQLNIPPISFQESQTCISLLVQLSVVLLPALLPEYLAFRSAFSFSLLCACCQHCQQEPDVQGSEHTI